MKISACITVKNRDKYLHKCVEALEQWDDVEIVVSDWNSDDTDYRWYKHKLIKIDKPYFSIGHGKNVAAAAATGDILFFVDADVITPRKVIDRAIEVVSSGNVYSPIMFMQNELGNGGEWGIHSYGQIAVSRDDFVNGDKWLEWTSYGGEDNVFFSQFIDRAVREQVDGFIHQWHPHILREKYGEHKAGYDLKQYIDKLEKRA